MRRLAERLYFHRRNDSGFDRDAYLRWLSAETQAKPVATRPLPR